MSLLLPLLSSSTSTSSSLIHFPLPLPSSPPTTSTSHTTSHHDHPVYCQFTARLSDEDRCRTETRRRIVGWKTKKILYVLLGCMSEGLHILPFPKGGGWGGGWGGFTTPALWIFPARELSFVVGCPVCLPASLSTGLPAARCPPPSSAPAAPCSISGRLSFSAELVPTGLAWLGSSVTRVGIVFPAGSRKPPARVRWEGLDFSFCLRFSYCSL